MAGKIFEGKVKSDKMDKTLVVSVHRKFREGRTGKIVQTRKNYMVHCEDESISAGDRVQFCESRPYSKNKKWRYLKVLTKAEKVLGTTAE